MIEKYKKCEFYTKLEIPRGATQSPIANCGAHDEGYLEESFQNISESEKQAVQRTTISNFSST